MPQFSHIAIVDPDLKRAQSLVHYLKKFDLTQIKYYSSPQKCYNSMAESPEKNPFTILFIFSNAKTNSVNIKLITDIMNHPELSQIQICAMTESHDELSLVALLKNGATTHLYYPLSFKAVQQAVSTLEKTFFKKIS